MSSYFASVNDVYGQNFTKTKSAVACDPAAALISPSDDYSFPYEKYEKSYTTSPDQMVERKVVAVDDSLTNPFTLKELRKRVVENDVPDESMGATRTCQEKYESMGATCACQDKYEREPISPAEIFLYILSGIIIILMMEQILQLGIHIRGF